MGLNVGELVAFLGVDDSEYNSKLGKAESNAKGFGSRVGSAFSAIGKVAGVAMVAAGVAVGAFAVSSVKDGLAFEKKMNEVFTLMPGITDKAMGAMTGQVKDFALKFGVLPEKVVPALYQSLSAGIPADNVFSFLEIAQKAAAGGVTDLTTAVDGISSVINAYGQDTLSATQASDLMFTTVRLGKTTFAELSESLFQVTPVAAGLGVGFDQVTAALAAITVQGVPTSVATTQLRQMFIELSKAGGTTADTFTGLAGETFTQFVAGGGNVQQALQLLEKEAGKTGLSVTDMFTSVEAGNAALALTGKGTATFSADLAAMGLSAGATDAAFATMQSGIDYNLGRLGAAFAVLKLQLWDELKPAFEGVVNWVVEHMPEIQATVQTVMDAVGVAVGEAIEIVDKFIKGFTEGGIKGGLEAIMPQETADRLISTFTAIKDVVLGVVGAVKEVIGVFISLPAPVQEAIIAVVALTVVLNALGLTHPVIKLVESAIAGLAPAAAKAAGGLSGVDAAAKGATVSSAGLSVGAVATAAAVAAAAVVWTGVGVEGLVRLANGERAASGDMNELRKTYGATTANVILNLVEMEAANGKWSGNVKEKFGLVQTILEQTKDKNREETEQIAADTIANWDKAQQAATTSTAQMAADAGKNLQQIVSDTKRLLEPIPPWVEMTLKGFSTAIGAAYSLGDQEAQRWASAIRNDTESSLSGVPSIASSSLSGLASAIGSQFQMAYGEAQRWAQAIRQVTANISPYIHMSPAPADVIIEGFNRLSGAMGSVWSGIESRSLAAVAIVRGAMTETGELAQSIADTAALTAVGYGTAGSTGNGGLAAAVTAAPPIVTRSGLSPEGEARWQAQLAADLQFSHANTGTTLSTGTNLAPQPIPIGMLMQMPDGSHVRWNGTGYDPVSAAPAVDIQPLINEMQGLRLEFKKQNDRALILARTGATA